MAEHGDVDPGTSVVEPRAVDGPAAVSGTSASPAARRPALWLAAALLVGIGAWSARGASGPMGTTRAATPPTSASPIALNGPAARGVPHELPFASLFGAAATSRADVPASRPLPGSEALLRRSNAAPGTPEARLLRVYALIASGDTVRALDEARRLADEVPTFSLAHLAYADLLKSRTAALPAFGAASDVVAERLAAAGAGGAASAASSAGLVNAPGTGPSPANEPISLADRLRDLSLEARARVGGATDLPPAGAIPSQFKFLSPSVRHAIAVDASRSRLYVFDNTPDGLVLRRDYYASVGKLGTAKRIEGDLRTPLGVYFVTGRLPKARLADRYGASAMVLNYPNQYDQWRGRTGSGIWVHGVESGYFSRAPLATDGCVALSNIDLLSLTQEVDRQATPVIIADHLDWVARGTPNAASDEFLRAFDAWRSARQAADPRAELAMYADAPRSAAASAPHWLDVLQGERAKPGSQAARLAPMSMLAWHDEDDLMLVTYSETSIRDSRERVKRQYWMRREGRWSIMFDGPVG